MSGIAFLRRILLKQAMKKSKDASGIMTLNKNLVKDVDNTVKTWIKSAKKQGQDIDKMGEQEIKYIVELNKPNVHQRTLEEFIEQIGLNDPKKNKFLRKEGEVVDMTGKKIKNTENIMGGMEGVEQRMNKIKGMSKKLAEMEKERAAIYGKGDIVTETIAVIKSKKPIDAMKEANSVIGRKGKYKNLTQEESQKILKETNDHIFQRDVPIDPEDFAQGGRTGTGLNYLLGEDDQNSRMPFGLGGMSKARRAFLKLMGGAAATGAAAKSGLFGLLKGGGKKAVIKDLTSVPIGNPPGMPVWFKPLVNKVIREGEDVTKVMSTKEREIVHQIGLEGKMSKDALGVHDVRVTQSLDDGTIRVEYNSPDTIGESGVELIYKKGEEIPITKKGKSTSVTEKDEFTAVEDDFYPQATSPDGDFDLEFTENIVKNVDDLYSDTSKLKQFATGEKLTLKEISDATKKKKILKEIDNNPNEHAFRNAPDYDGPYYEDDYASGGRVPYFAGDIVDPEGYNISKREMGILANADPSKKEMIREFLKRIKHHKPIYPDRILEINRGRRTGEASGGRVPLAEGNTPSDTQLEQYYRNLEEEKKRRRLQKQLYEQRFGGPGPVLEAASGGLAGMLGE